jgi:hypothetical protein
MKKLYFFLIAALGLSMMLFARSGGAGSQSSARTSGAPGEGVCANCHLGGPGGGSITITNSSLPGNYIPGQVYTLQVQIFDNNAAEGGFQASIRDAANNAVGTLNAGSGTQTVMLAGREYIEHSTPQSFNAGQTTWTFDWEAPAANVGPVTMYVSGVAANGTGGTNGDAGYASIQSLGTLAVNWGEMKVITNQEPGLATVQWESLQEFGSNFFDVEQSIDGESFQSIGRVKAKGSANEATAYQFTTKVPVYNQDYLYRIAEIDESGQKYYSPSIKAYVERASGMLGLYPNPLIMNQNLQVDYILANSSLLSAYLIDAQGNRSQLFSQAMLAGNHKLDIPLEGYPSGNYYLLIEGDEQRDIKAFIIAR